MPCPICDAPLKTVEKDELMGWGLMYSTDDCPNGHYREEYAYGATRCFVGRWEFREGSRWEGLAIRWYRFWRKVGTPIRWVCNW